MRPLLRSTAARKAQGFFEANNVLVHSESCRPLKMPGCSDYVGEQKGMWGMRLTLLTLQGFALLVRW